MKTALSLVTALSVALCVAGGTLIGAGVRGLGYVVAAVGAGWLGILYGHLIRLAKEESQ